MSSTGYFYYIINKYQSKLKYSPPSNSTPLLPLLLLCTTIINPPLPTVFTFVCLYVYICMYVYACFTCFSLRASLLLFFVLFFYDQYVKKSMFNDWLSDCLWVLMLYYTLFMILIPCFFILISFIVSVIIKRTYYKPYRNPFFLI